MATSSMGNYMMGMSGAAAHAAAAVGMRAAPGAAGHPQAAAAAAAHMAAGMRGGAAAAGHPAMAGLRPPPGMPHHAGAAAASQLAISRPYFM